MTFRPIARAFAAFCQMVEEFGTLCLDHFSRRQVSKRKFM
jgi:hypothetical protein